MGASLYIAGFVWKSRTRTVDADADSGHGQKQACSHGYFGASLIASYIVRPINHLKSVPAGVKSYGAQFKACFKCAFKF